jgi:hypothetical protein
MLFAHIKRVPSISLHSWGAKCDEHQCDAYDKVYHNNKVKINKYHQVMIITRAIRSKATLPYRIMNKSYKLKVSLGTPPHITQVQVSMSTSTRSSRFKATRC